MHEPYEKRLNHKADFRVKYKFRSPENGGRKTGAPHQGIRCDFSFVGEHEWAATAFSLTGTSAIAAGAIGGFIGGVAGYFEDDF